MPSPFPGMDPFIEQQEWDDFHVSFNVAISEALGPLVRPRFIVRIERRVYLDHRSDLDAMESRRFQAVPEERREAYLVIRDLELKRITTVIETLSPANKRRGGDGWREYLSKRDQVLASQSHLVELDLLRGGTRLPVKPPLTGGDYFAIVSRAQRRPRGEVYTWSLDQPMPTIAIPLLPEDDQIPLDLQRVFDIVYERAFYYSSLDYTAELTPPLSDAERQWLKSGGSG